jgi:hypothetical protein
MAEMLSLVNHLSCRNWHMISLSCMNVYKTFYKQQQQQQQQQQQTNLFMVKIKYIQIIIACK